MTDVVLTLPGQALVDLVADAGFIEAVLESAFERWKEHVHAELRSSTYAYTQAMRPPVLESSTNGYLELDASRAPLAGYVETGLAPFDMRKTHIRGGKSYAVVAFDRGFSSRGPGAAFGAGYRKQLGAAAARDIKKSVRAFTRAHPGEVIPKGLAPVLPGHATDLYARSEPNEGARTPYITFRTISENSTGWQHPGIEAHQLLERVGDDVVNGLAQAALDALAARLGGP